MKWASSISFETDLGTALTGIKRDLVQKLGESPDLLLVFVTPHFEDQTRRLPELVAARVSPGLLLGCTAVGVIGGGREVEERCAVVAVGASLPDVTMTPFRLTAGDLPDLDTGPSHWHEALGIDPEPGTHFLLLADPGGTLTFDPRPLLMGLDFAYPASTTTGGLASVLQENRLFLDDAVFEGGCVGVATTGLKSDLGRGDFLMRNVLQLDHEKGVISVGDLLRNGQTIQFHLRDATTAGEDLADMLERYRREQPGVDPAGALLFTCTGRGQRFFGTTGHDSGRFVEHLGDVPIGGFFCGGEIAPVGGTTYLHGYTSAFAVFRPASRD